MSRIHLIAPASTLNKGDAAIYVGAVKLIAQYLPKCEISMSVEGYGKTANILRMFDSKTIKLQKGLLQGIKSSFIKKTSISSFGNEHENISASGFFNQFHFSKFFQVPFLLTEINKYSRLESEPFDSINESDAVVVLGHNLETSTLPMFLLNYSVPKLIYNKKTLIFPISISAFQNSDGLSNDIHEVYAKFILRQMDCIMLREPSSQSLLRDKLHIHNNTTLVADTAFFLPKDDFQGVEIKKPALAVCVRGEGYFKNYSKYIAISYSSFIQNLAKNLDGLIEKIGVNVYFVPMTIYPHINFDRYDYVGALSVFREMKQRNKAQIINTWEMTPGEIASLLEQMDFVLTTRLHQAIVAATVGTPSALIMPLQDNKGLAIMRSLGLGDYFINLGLPEEKLNKVIPEKVKEGYDNRVNLKKTVNSRLPSVKNEAAGAAKLLASLIS